MAAYLIYPITEDDYLDLLNQLNTLNSELKEKATIICNEYSELAKKYGNVPSLTNKNALHDKLLIFDTFLNTIDDYVVESTQLLRGFK